MKRRDNVATSILSMVGLWIVIIFLSSAVVRLFCAIVRTFIYLVGLVSVFLMVGIVIAIFSCVIYIVIKSLTNCQRTVVDKLELINSVINIQLKTIIVLIFVYLILGIAYLLLI